MPTRCGDSALRGDSGAAVLTGRGSPAPAQQPQVKFLPGNNQQMWGWPAQVTFIGFNQPGCMPPLPMRGPQ